jgi:hypothetical protein
LVPASIPSTPGRASASYPSSPLFESSKNGVDDSVKLWFLVLTGFSSISQFLFMLNDIDIGLAKLVGSQLREVLRN